jgi:tetratricopeptide (TPR) repeat protein
MKNLHKKPSDSELGASQNPKNHRGSQSQSDRSVDKGFEEELMDGNDSLLFSTIGDYMKGRSDLEDVRNDPAFSETMASVSLMMSESDAKKGNEKNMEFIREAFAAKAGDEKLKIEVALIKQEAEENKLNEITAEWVREWHERKQNSVPGDTEREKITDFVTAAFNSSDTAPPEPVREVSIKRTTRTTFVKYFSFAAAAITGVFILLRTLLPSSDPGEIFSSYYKPFEAMSTVTRGFNTKEPDTYSAAIKSYMEADYTAATAGFERVTENDPSYASSRFYAGLSQLALGNYNKAIPLLSDNLAMSGEFGKEARWYLGLAYLKVSDREKASECFRFLSSSDGFYRERSAKILRRLK